MVKVNEKKAAPVKQAVQTKKTETKAAAPKKAETKAAPKNEPAKKSPVKESAKTNAVKKEKAAEFNDPISQLLDPKNTAVITLYDEEDKQVNFEQIAIIPLNKKLYAILKPVEYMEGVGEDEAIAFVVSEETDDKGGAEQILVVVEDDAEIDAVFEEYHHLLKADKKTGK